ncbi:MAG: ribonuclease R [Longimicrobiales bacterium]
MADATTLPHAERIVQYLREEAGRPLKAKELSKALEVPEHAYADFRQRLDELESAGLLYRVKKQRYAAPDKINLVVGTLQTIRSGAGFVLPEDGRGEDLFIPFESLGSAVHGDRVVARVEGRRRRERPRGRIVRVLERARQTVVGVYHSTRNFGFVTPEDRKLPRDVFVPPGQEAGAADGQVVVARITDWGDEHKGPVGEVTDVLGAMDEPGVDVLAVIHGHELATDFPAAVEAEAERLRERGIGAADVDGRLDLRDRVVVTIDPADAKDHDDALSIRRLDDDRFEVGIHIADVGHFVVEGSAIDREAIERGTSVYLVDRTIPMLPEALSTELCSLLPDVDRLALSLILVLDADGEVLEDRLARTVLRCGARLSYEDAQAVILGQRSISPDVDGSIRSLAELAGAIRTRRTERGSLDFDLPESRVILGPGGDPVDIQRVLRLESHKLVEDFMILANEVVARKAAGPGLPFIYRIHEPPAEDRIEQLREFLGTFGLRLGTRGRPKPGDVRQVLRQVEGRPEEALISTAILRSMKQARYSEDNAGHFGLASTAYTHFTSPIRRYPDLVVHRLLASAFIDRAARRGEELRGELGDVARLCSARERVAVDAERDSVDLKKTEFMQRHVGDEFDGTISGVTSFGMFVLLDRYHVEGLVHMSSLDDDYYVFLEEQFALLGENTRRRFQLGDRVRVRVLAVDIEQRKIDFQLV